MWYNKTWQGLSILIIFSLYTCTYDKNSNTETVIIDKFNIESNLDFETIEIPPLALSPSNIIISDDKLLLYQMKKDTLFDVFRLPECTYLYSDGFRGQGPNDFDNIDTRSLLSTSNSRFSFFDMGKSMLKEVVITNNHLSINDKTKQYFDIADRPVNGFKQLNDSSFFYWNTSSEDTEYILFNNHIPSKTYKAISYPDWEKNQFIEQNKIFTYMKNDVVKSDGTLFASFYAYFKRIRIHDSFGNLKKK
ncbi:hypothetical protein AGMMS50262_07060 [Bacteroidia bacterium]|nr:hypothetical protein AGMMS50262_07060 [Bacteroidia bacterium]